MSTVEVSGNTITVSNMQASVRDLVKSVISQYGRGSIKGNNLTIDGSLHLKNCYITGERYNITITGNYFIVDENSTLRLGISNKYYNGYNYYNGCILSMPNGKLFGNFENNAGRILLSDSTLDMFFNWNITGPQARLSLIGCKISAYGDYQGLGSVLSNVTYLKLSGKYGMLRPIENQGVIENISISGIVELDAVRPSAIKVNGNIKFSIHNSTLDNYKDLVSTTNSSSVLELDLFSCDVKNGYDIDVPLNTKVNIRHNYKLKAKVMNDDGKLLPNKEILLTNNLGEDIPIRTNSQGNINEYLPFYRLDTNNSDKGEFLSPYTLAVDNYKQPLLLEGDVLGASIVIPDGVKNKNYEELVLLFEELAKVNKLEVENTHNTLTAIVEALEDKIKRSTVDKHRVNGVTIKF